jgi:hypothetical protein
MPTTIEENVRAMLARIEEQCNEVIVNDGVREWGDLEALEVELDADGFEGWSVENALGILVHVDPEGVAAMSKRLTLAMGAAPAPTPLTPDFPASNFVGAAQWATGFDASEGVAILAVRDEGGRALVAEFASSAELAVLQEHVAELAKKLADAEGPKQ